MSPLFRAHDVGPLQIKPAPKHNGARRDEVLVRMPRLTTVDGSGNERPAEEPLGRDDLEQLRDVIDEALR